LKEEFPFKLVLSKDHTTTAMSAKAALAAHISATGGQVKASLLSAVAVADAAKADTVVSDAFGTDAALLQAIKGSELFKEQAFLDYVEANFKNKTDTAVDGCIKMLAGLEEPPVQFKDYGADLMTHLGLGKPRLLWHVVLIVGGVMQCVGWPRKEMTTLIKLIYAGPITLKEIRDSDPDQTAKSVPPRAVPPILPAPLSTECQPASKDEGKVMEVPVVSFPEGKSSTEVKPFPKRLPAPSKGEMPFDTLQHNVACFIGWSQLSVVFSQDLHDVISTLIRNKGINSIVEGVQERARFILSDKKLYHWLSKVSEVPVGHALRVEPYQRKDLREALLEVYALHMRTIEYEENAKGQAFTPFKVTIALGAENLKAASRRTVKEVRESAPLSDVCEAMVSKGFDPETGAVTTTRSTVKRVSVERDDPPPKRDAKAGNGGGGKTCHACGASDHKRDSFKCPKFKPRTPGQQAAFRKWLEKKADEVQPKGVHAPKAGTKPAAKPGGKVVKDEGEESD